MNREIFDNGILRVIVPSGWKLFYGIDADGNESPKKLHIYKDAQTGLDVFTKAGITICFYGKGEIYISPRAFYDNVQDLESFALGGYIWHGYTCTSLGYPYTMLETMCDGVTFQIMILMENGEHKISLNDADVQLIIESISICE
jgi:hypothetical protein